MNLKIYSFNNNDEKLKAFDHEREKLILQYSKPQSLVKRIISNKIIQSTYKIANTPPYITKPIEELKLYYPKYTFLNNLLPIGALIFLASLITKVDEKYHFLLIVFFLICISIPGYFFIADLVKHFDRRATLIINKEGIGSEVKDFLIEWDDIVETYIKTIPRDNSDTEIVVIHYYSSQIETFLKKEITIESSKIKANTVAYAIELMKFKRR